MYVHNFSKLYKFSHLLINFNFAVFFSLKQIAYFLLCDRCGFVCFVFI